jgi:di/tricarboxylate transporter
VTEKLRIDVAALCVLVALLVLRLIEPGQALYGFANAATGTVAAMFVLSAGLVRTGLVDWLARHLDRIAGKGETRLVLILCITIAALSAFILNTAAIAIFIPIGMALARSRKVAGSRVLMPLSFASQFGGVCTLIGTSTNILVNSIAVENGMKGFGLFEFAKLGLIMSVLGIGYLLLVGKWLLPRRKGKGQQIDKYRLADYLIELRVKAESPLLDKRWEDMRAKDLKGINLIKVIRDDKATSRPSSTKLRHNDTLLVHGSADKLMKMKDNYLLETRGDVAVSDERLSSYEARLLEALVPPRSGLVGRTLRGYSFKRRFGCVVLALQRRGKVLRERLEDIRVDGGDTLLLQCDEEEDVKRIMRSSDLVATNEVTELHLRKDRAAIGLGLLALVVVLAAFNVVPILVAALIGAVGMLLGRCLTIEEAYQSIDWKVIFLLGGVLPLGLALQQTGTAGWLAGTVLAPIVRLGPLAVLAALYLFCAVLTEAMSNNAAVVLLAPIALSAASSLNIDPRPLLIAITFAASTSFATPIGYQTNTMIHGPGGYRFSDFTRLGGPLNFLFWMTAVIFIPLLWPF